MNMPEDMIMMKDGRVMRVQDQRMTPLDQEMTMADGTRVMMDGTVILTDGTTRMMQEGETMYTAERTADTPQMPSIGATGEGQDTETHDPS
jgi:hypothetical protein